MNNIWPTRKLRDIAAIRVSNVDKKSHTAETPVRLCNYMDVYANDYITNEIDFMRASASPAEIERFSLQSGDVIITKDSETPDDIGVPAVVSDEIDGLVCGYHLCLIRPNDSALNSAYLAKQLATSKFAGYFALHASGSTRFGLPIDAIENIDLPFPPKSEQTKIAEILSTVDQAVEQTEALIAKQQRIKTGLMQDLLTRGIDENGSLRSEENHEFKDSPLGRIPVEWEVKPVGRVFSVQLGKMLSKESKTGEDPFPYVGNKNVQWERIDSNAVEWMDFSPQEREKFVLAPGDILVCEGGEVGRSCVWQGEISSCFYQKAVHRLRPKERYNTKLFPKFMRWAIARGVLSDFTSQTSISHLTKEKLEALPITIQREEEQARICRAFDCVDASVLSAENQLGKLTALKTALMQDLLTGKVSVAPLLTDAEGGV